MTHRRKGQTMIDLHLNGCPDGTLKLAEVLGVQQKKRDFMRSHSLHHDTVAGIPPILHSRT